MTVRKRVWFFRSLAILWGLLVIPALLWWHDSVLFVIVMSLYANMAASLSAASAEDDQKICRRLDRIEQALNTLLEQRSPDGR